MGADSHSFFKVVVVLGWIVLQSQVPFCLQISLRGTREDGRLKSLHCTGIRLAKGAPNQGSAASQLAEQSEMAERGTESWDLRSEQRLLHRVRPS